MNRLARAASILSLLVYLSSGPPAGATPVDLTVMTQNLYLGANTDAVLASPNEATLTAALNSIVANKFPTRAGEIANGDRQSGCFKFVAQSLGPDVLREKILVENDGEFLFRRPVFRRLE